MWVMPEAPPPQSFDASHLGEALLPALREACGGRLGPVEVFRSPFQHGGAMTGFSTWERDDGSRTKVMVKLPVGSIEHRWGVALGSYEHHRFECEEAICCPVPRVLASGTSVGGYDFAWIVVERLSSPGVISRPEEKHVHEILETLVEFQARAAAVPLEGAKKSPDWERLLERSREAARNGIVEDSKHWSEAIHKVQKVLPILRGKWERRAINAWCHGDLHLGNLLHRATAAGPTGQSVLVDLALVHAGHWVEDAIYFERQYWGHSDLLKGVKPASELARLRRERGLNANDNYPELANVRRVLMAACVPAAAEREGNAKYVAAALELLERLLPQVAK